MEILHDLVTVIGEYAALRNARSLITPLGRLPYTKTLQSGNLPVEVQGHFALHHEELVVPPRLSVHVTRQN